MKRIACRIFSLFLIFALAAALSPAVFAQENAAEEKSVEDTQNEHENKSPVQKEERYNAGTYKGDKYIRLSLGPNFPLTFGNVFTADRYMSVGGSGSIGIHSYITDHISVGADALFTYNSTIGSNVLNSVPVIANITYQTNWKNFEFPLTLGLGIAWEHYANLTYWPGLVAQAQSGIHYRLAPDWSLGGDITYFFMPQFNEFWKTGEKNNYAQFMNVHITARYYF